MGWRTFPAKRLNLGAPATSERLEESNEHQGNRYRSSSTKSVRRLRRSSTSPSTSASHAGRPHVPRCRAGFTASGSRSPHRPDPVDLLEEQAQTRVPELVPIRYGRMLVSPFTFYRGAAALMASDLAGSPRTGLHAQLCGDAHLSNFGGFAAPDRQHGLRRQRPGRVAAGPVRMGRQAPGRELRRRRPRPRVLRQGARRASTSRSAGRTGSRCGSSRRCATSTSGMRASTSRTLFAKFGSTVTAEQRKRAEKNVAHARTKDSLKALGKLTAARRRRAADRQRPAADRPDPRARRAEQVEEWQEALGNLIRSYRRTLAGDRRRLLERFRYVDAAQEGRRRRQRRHAGLDRPPRRSRQRRSALPAGQGGRGLGARAVSRQEQLREPRPAGRGGPAADAGCERHHARLDP